MLSESNWRSQELTRKLPNLPGNREIPVLVSSVREGNDLKTRQDGIQRQKAKKLARISGREDAF